MRGSGGLMESYSFKSVAFGGFDKQDVVRYLEQASEKAAAVQRELEEENGNLRKQAEETAEELERLRAQVEELALPCLGKTRGLGLMIGVEVKGDRTNGELAAQLIDNGLLVLTAGPGLRFLPPLTITREEMDKGLAILKETLG